MYSKYDEKHRELSIAYNRNLEAGDFESALKNLDGLAEIAQLEGRPNDLAKLLEIKDGIEAHIRIALHRNVK